MESIREQLQSAIQALYGLKDFDPVITPAPEGIAADYSTNAPLQLAHLLHQPPMNIAEQLAGELKNTLFKGNYRFAGSETYIPDGPEKAARRADLPGAPAYDVESTQVYPEKSIFSSPPGFLNFISPDEYLQAEITKYATDFTKNISSGEYSGQTVICEFSDPNPFKVLHVGHLYTSIIGDAISRLFEHAGARVIRANFGGDVGLHVAKTMYALQQKLQPQSQHSQSLQAQQSQQQQVQPASQSSQVQPTPPTLQSLTIEDIATCYVAGTAAYEDDPVAQQEITTLNKEIYRINAADLHGTPLADLYWRGRELSYAYFQQFYAQIGVHFDKFYPESSVAALGLATVKNQLANGVYQESAGAVVFNGEQYGLHTRVFINREGVPTYEAKDVGLLFTKWQDYHFDRSIVITGSEQLEYMKVVLKSVEQFAPELVEKTTHLTHGLVKLPGNVKMSSRKGNFLKAVDVLRLVQEELESQYGSKDTTISLAATKYAFLRYKMGGHIVFDPRESVSMTGHSGPYLLYSAVRAKKILEKVAISKGDKHGSSETVPRTAYEPFEGSEPRNDRPLGRSPAPLGGRERTRSSGAGLATPERTLMKKILEYKPTLTTSLHELAPHKIANYLYELAQAFSSFYESCPVAGSPEEASRVQIVQAYLNVMTHGLGLLGINIPEEM